MKFWSHVGAEVRKFYLIRGFMLCGVPEKPWGFHSLGLLRLPEENVVEPDAACGGDGILC